MLFITYSVANLGEVPRGVCISLILGREKRRNDIRKKSQQGKKNKNTPPL